MTNRPDENDQEDDHGKDKWLDGIDTYIEVLEAAKPKPKTDYHRKIRERAAAMKAEAEWKLRKTQEKPKGQAPTPTMPETPATTTPKPKADHGKAPQAPQGQEYFWYDYQPKNGGGQ